MNNLFITGASGFIGSHLIRSLNPKNYSHIYCLSRTVPDVQSCSCLHNNVKFLQGSIFDFESYAHHLAKSDIVIHLAAVTGKAKAAEYFNINAHGTSFLTRKCEQVGVKKFLYISSIAVKFEDISQYFYAQSKKQAERSVRNSGLKYTILRPTIVIGEEAPIWKNISRLAKGPLCIVFGDGSTKIQPIYIDDLINIILLIVSESIFKDETYDIGGPDVISFQDFLRLIHRTYTGKDSPIVHIPLGLLTRTTSLIEKKFYHIMPINVGQLSSFSNEGTTDEKSVFAFQLPNMKPVKAMVSLVRKQEKEGLWTNELANECRVFSSYLLNHNADSHVIKKYIEGHKANTINLSNGGLCFDKLIMRIARFNSFLTKLSDVYTRVFHKHSALRKKLVLLLAILESYSTTYLSVDSVSEDRAFSFYMRLAQNVLVSALLLLASIIILLPVHAVFCLWSLRLRRIS